MTILALLPKKATKPLQLPESSGGVEHLGALTDDHVIIRFSNKAGDPTIITINCPTRLGLACDVAKSILEFGLDIAQADFSTDGRWGLLLFWVTPRQGFTQSIKWDLLKKCLISECPPPSSLVFMLYSGFKACTKKNNYLLQTCSPDRIGLLNDIAHTLRELEVEVLKVNSLTSPNGSAVNVFLISDIRSEPQDKRQETICDNVKSTLGASHSFCELSMATFDDLNETVDLVMDSVPEELLTETPTSIEAAVDVSAPNAQKFSLNIDNSLSPRHTVLQFTSRDRRGLLYDCMRALKDLNLQIAYGRLTKTSIGCVAFELFVSQANGTKLIDPDKQKSLQTRLRLDMCDPIRVTIVDKGPSTELLVAMTVEACGRARPHILHDVTSVLKALSIGIFKAGNEKLCHGDRIWEVYKFLLVERPNLPFSSIRTRSHIVERVRSALIG